MFANPTVFVIGAGASAEYRLPLGSALRDRIASAVNYRYKEDGLLQNGDETLLNAINRQFNSEKTTVDSYIAAGRDLAASMSMHASIDEALQYWSNKPEAVQLGKIAIANEILGAESHSSLSKNRETGRVDVPQSGWIWPFLSMTLGSDLTREQAEQAFANVTLINFNYDRTVEQYLYWALQQYGRVSADVAANAVTSLKQIRPYGSIGNLPWQENPGPPFGESEEGDNLFSLAKSIRTYTEQQYEGTDQTIDQALDSARLVIFLGFGYHPQNMRLLKPIPGKIYPQIHTVIATAMEVPSEDRHAIEEQLRATFKEGDVFPRGVTLFPTTCDDVLTRHKLSVVAGANF
jgi:hypothetical protein